MLWDWATNLGAGGIPAAVVPAGFASIQDSTDDASDTRTILSRKIATGSEGTLTGMDADEELKTLLVFRGDIPIVAAVPGSAAGQVTDGGPSAQVVTASGGAAPLVVIAGYATRTGSVNPRTFSPAKDGEIEDGTQDMYLAWKIYNAAPADTTVDMDDEGDINGLSSCYIACA